MHAIGWVIVGIDISITIFVAVELINCFLDEHKTKNKK